MVCHLAIIDAKVTVRWALSNGRLFIAVQQTLREVGLMKARQTEADDMCLQSTCFYS